MPYLTSGQPRWLADGARPRSTPYRLSLSQGERHPLAKELPVNTSPTGFGQHPASNQQEKRRPTPHPANDVAQNLVAGVAFVALVVSGNVPPLRALEATAALMLCIKFMLYGPILIVRAEEKSRRFVRS